MDYKLLLCEILFNKALCMKSSGLVCLKNNNIKIIKKGESNSYKQSEVAQVMRQATSCRMMRNEKERYRFDDLCNSVASGDVCRRGRGEREKE
jgi:hypothetical protein